MCGMIFAVVFLLGNMDKGSQLDRADGQQARKNEKWEEEKKRKRKTQEKKETLGG